MTAYLDNNATTMVAPEVVAEMAPYFSQFFGNPSSMHSFGAQVKKHVDLARERVAALVGADPWEIVFTAGGSEADNHAIRGALEAAPAGKKHIITTRVEHPAVLETFRYLAKRGYRVTELGVDTDGALDLAELEEALTPDTALVSLMWANNETGVVFPLEEIAPLVKSRGAVLHTDAVQAAGKLAMDVGRVPVDLLAISGHKFHAPKGIGALYIRRGTKVIPLIQGGHQEHGRRAGTENVPGIVALGRAAQLAKRQADGGEAEIRALRHRMENGLMATSPGAGLNENSGFPKTSKIKYNKSRA